MNKSEHQHAVRIFEAALELPDCERHAYVSAACGNDAALRAEVESLLSADEDASGFLEPPVSATIPQQSASDSRIGSRIGNYEIVRVIATGGMGTVYEAEQQVPHRTVALKIMRAGIVSPSAMKRFRNESEILARLRHPGIAQIYEAGTAGDSGDTPYFAMEFVPGALSITQYAERQHLTTHERLVLFLKVCEAVHAGHQRGIIHRDLKPANILIDEGGQPKLIDFGVARATNADMTIATFQTDVGELVGTLRYMSPEQCDGQAEEVDTRSDVYALGVVLFELLTGQLPYDFSSSSPFEAPRVIQQQDPHRLSAINRQLSGDVETIVLKTLEKDRTRRYQSVPELVEDIRRFQQHEPIKARRATRLYVLRKIVRRHRGATAAILVFVVLLAAFSATVFSLYRRSEQEAQTAKDTVEVLQRTLTQVDPFAAGGSEALVGLLNKMSRQLEEKSITNPHVRAALHRTLGTSYMNLGHYDEGGEHLKTAYQSYRELLGEEHVETADCLGKLAVWQYSMGDYTAAQESLQRAIPILESDADASRRQELGRCYGRLAIVCMFQQRPQEGEVAARKFLAISEEAEDDIEGNVATAANIVSIMLQEQGRLAEAEPFQRQALADDRVQWGDRHPRVARDLENLALLLRKLKQYDQAENAMRECLNIGEDVYPADNAGYVLGKQNLANILAEKGDLAEARELHFETANRIRQILGENHPTTADVLGQVADFLLMTGEYEEALAKSEEALAIAKASYPEGHPSVYMHQILLGRCLTTLARFDEAEPLLLAAKNGLIKTMGAEDGRTQEADAALARLYELTNRQPSNQAVSTVTAQTDDQ